MNRPCVFLVLFQPRIGKLPALGDLPELLVLLRVEKHPAGAMNFSPFHWMGLWLAVTAIPPAAFFLSTASATVGVGQIPMAITSHPIWSRVDVTICAIDRTCDPSVPADNDRAPVAVFRECCCVSDDNFRSQRLRRRHRGCRKCSPLKT